MAFLILNGLLTCNNLLAWATLQQPYTSKSLSPPPPRNSNKWVHSIIFEPQPKIQLTGSSYKVTSCLDFQPFLQGFQSVNDYLHNLWADINNPMYYYCLFLSFGHVEIDPTSNDSHISDFLRSSACYQHPYACQAKIKFKCFKWEIHYMMKVFHITHKKFLTAIDHIDYHPTNM